jgi:hypothetical protein
MKYDEPVAPTIDEIIAEWKAMASALKPKRPRTKPILLGSRASRVEAMQFEQFRPKRSAARWLKGAPGYVIACYDNAGRAASRYTVLFGGSLWDTDYARTNWEAGLDPRLTQCLLMAEASAHLPGVSTWSQCLRGSHLGRKINWLDLPEHLREHVIMRAHQWLGDSFL